MESSQSRKKKEECWKLLCSGKRGAGVRQSHAIPNWPHYSQLCMPAEELGYRNPCGIFTKYFLVVKKMV